MAKKSKTQKKLEREREQRERFMELPLVPKDSYADADGVWHFSDGSYMPNGLYRTAEGGVTVYEGNPDRQLGVGVAVLHTNTPKSGQNHPDLERALPSACIESRETA